MRRIRAGYRLPRAFKSYARWHGDPRTVKYTLHSPVSQSVSFWHALPKVPTARAGGAIAAFDLSVGEAETAISRSNEPIPNREEVIVIERRAADFQRRLVAACGDLDEVEVE